MLKARSLGSQMSVANLEHREHTTVNEVLLEHPDQHITTSHHLGVAVV